MGVTLSLSGEQPIQKLFSDAVFGCDIRRILKPMPLTCHHFQLHLTTGSHYGFV
jgi:hypothetical protein